MILVVLELATDGEQRLAAVQRQELRVPADHAGHMPARPRTAVRRGEYDASFRCGRPVPVPRALLRAAPRRHGRHRCRRCRSGEASKLVDGGLGGPNF